MTERRGPLLRRATFALLAIAVALTAAACGGGDTSASDSTTSEPRATSDAAPAATGVALIADAARRAQDAPALTVRTTTTVGDAAPSVITTRSNADASLVSVVADLPGTGRLEARRVDGTLYVQVPGLGGGAQWMSIGTATDAGPFAEMFDRFVDEDPRFPFRSLTDVSSDVVELERTTVEGVPVTRYRVAVDVADLSGPDAPAELSGRTDLDVWVDDEGSIRQLRYELDGATVDMPGTTVVIESTVVDSDEPLRVDPPPSDVTVPLDQLLANGDLSGLAAALGGN